MALLAADIPFGRRLGRDVVVDRVAAIAQRARGASGIVASGVRIMRHPPIAVGRDMVRKPSFVRNVPLRGEREIVIANLPEISLLPAAAIDEGNILLLEGKHRVRFGKVRYQRIGMDLWIAYHVRHPSLAPASVDVPMTAFASNGTYVVRG